MDLEKSKFSIYSSVYILNNREIVLRASLIQIEGNFIRSSKLFLNHASMKFSEK